MAHHGIFRNPHLSRLVKRKHSHGEHVGRDENSSEESSTVQTISHGTAIPESNSDSTSGHELQDITQRDVTYNVTDSSQSSTNGNQGSMAITMTNTNPQTTSLDTTATPLPTSTSESDVSQPTTSNDSTSSSEVVSSTSSSPDELSTTSSESSSTTTDTSAVTSDYESTTASTASTASTTSLSSSSDSSSSTYVSFQVSTSLIASAETLHPSSSIPTVKPSMLIIVTSSTSLSQTTPTSTMTLSLSSSSTSSSSSDSDYGLGFIPASTSTSSSSTSSYTSTTTTSWTISSTTSSSTLTSNSTTYLDRTTTGGQWAGGGGSDATGTGQIPSATASQSPSSSGSSTTNKIVGGVVGGVAGAFFLLAFLFLLLRRRQATLRQATRGLSASDVAGGTGGEGSISRAEMASRRSSNDPLFLASYLAPAFMQRWRQSSQSTRSDSTSSERGFQKISGRKIPSVLQSGGDGYGGGFEEGSPTASEPSVSIPPGSPVHPRSSISQPPPSMPFGMPLDASYTREAQEPDPFVVFRPSPARMAVASSPPSASRAAIPQRPDGLGRSHPSFDGSRGSRFTESLEGL